MKRIFLFLFLFLLLFTGAASSHPGRTDSNGGHWDRKEGTYHYHSGEYAGENSSGSSLVTSDDIKLNKAKTATSDKTTKEASNETAKETSEEASKQSFTNESKQKESTEEEKPRGIDSKTIIIIVAIIVGGIVLFFIFKWAIHRYDAEEFCGTLFIITIIIVGVVLLRGCKNSETYDSHIENCDGTCSHIEDYCEEYPNQVDALENELEEEMKTGERHNDYCDGHCDHVEDEISDRVYDGELIRSYEALDEEDLNDSYWEGVYDGYIQGYGDCYYGNKQELELDDYQDEELF